MDQKIRTTDSYTTFVIKDIGDFSCFYDIYKPQLATTDCVLSGYLRQQTPEKEEEKEQEPSLRTGPCTVCTT